MGRDDIKPRTVYIIHLKKDRELDEEHRLAYVGSTGKSLSKRLSNHLSFARTGGGTNRVCKTLNDWGLDAWMITPLETMVCDRRAIVTLEDEYIGLIEPSLNSIRAVLDRETELCKQRERSGVRCYCHECETWFNAGDRSRHLKSSWHLLNYLD